MTHLKTGDAAPDFMLFDEKKIIRRLSDFQGKKLVLYFYPKDDTPGCTAESCNLRDNYHRFLAKGLAVLGISPDTPRSHTKFIEKYSLPFGLLADKDGLTAQAYGVWGEKLFWGKKYMGVLRTTFVIDENGKIENVISEVDEVNHADQLLSN